jgi:hypothetical protein
MAIATFREENPFEVKNEVDEGEEKMDILEE